MGDCKCVHAKVSVTQDLHASVTIGGQPNASVSVGTFATRDGTKDYEKLDNLPRIEGCVLKGDRTIGEIGVGTITPQDIDNLIFG